MNKAAVKQMVLPVVILFIILNGVYISLGKWLDKNKIDHAVLLYANILFFALGLITAFIHLSALKNKNPYAFVRSVTLSSFLKLFVVAVAVLIYLFKAGENRSIYAIALSMVMYILYTILEVKAAMRLNKNKNA